MNIQTMAQTNLPGYGRLGQGVIKVYADLAGETIHCLSGCLWVTLEHDGNDYILLVGDSLAFPREGKVVVSGPGFFALSRGGESMGVPLASCSPPPRFRSASPATG
jgi:hypothetical protein